MAATSAPPSLSENHGDGGFLLLFAAAVLVITAAVVVAAAVGQLWVLAPVMLVDFGMTAVVTLAIARLLADGA